MASMAPPPLAGRVAAAVVLLEPAVEVAEAGRVDAVAKKPAEAEPRATGRGGGGVAGRGAAAAWGDTRTRNVDRPDHRAGRGLSRLAHDTNKYFKANSNARVFFISEGKPHEFEEFRTIVPSTEWRLDDAWKDALWTISQSNIVIGGTSSFFALGAHLCSQCTVVTIKSHPKFRAHRFEKTTHHNLQQLKLR